MFSNQQPSDTDYVDVADYVADMTINPTASKLAKMRSGKQTELSSSSLPPSSPLLPSLVLPPSSSLPPLLPLTPLLLPTTVDNRPTYDSSDNSYSDLSISVPVMMLTKLNVEVMHTGSNKPPVLSAGTVLPKVLHQFKHMCHSFFRNKEGLEPKDFVTHVVGSLHDPLILDW